jgi:hypothetical protein
MDKTEIFLRLIEMAMRVNPSQTLEIAALDAKKALDVLVKQDSGTSPHGTSCRDSRFRRFSQVF